MLGGVDLLPTGEQKLLDRYQLIGDIAAGGMATVFLARLAGVGGFQRLVAIKRLHPHLAHEKAFVEMFLDEARLAARIHHKNVVPILEIGNSPGGYYIVMEYVEGVNLARLLTQATAKQEPIDRPVLLRIIIDTLVGLHAAHELTDDAGESFGVVHRDCSPQNILIGVDGSTKITDFGIARATSRLHNTREGAMKGKLAYMAPEQTQGEAFDRRADLFSVGVVLWEVLASRRLFKGTTEAQTLRRLLHDSIPTVTEVVGDLHAGYDTLCAKALQREPADRFQDALEMADAVERAAREAGETVASERQVAALMKARYGDDVAQQRDALRNWLQATPTSVVDESENVTQKDLDGLEAIPAPPKTIRGLGGSTPPARQPSSAPPPPPKRVSKAPNTQRAWPKGAAGIGAPQSPDEDETLIYDPTSTTGVTAEPLPESYLTPLVPPAPPSLDPPLPMRSNRRWVIAVLGAVAVGVLGVFVIRRLTVTDDAGAAATTVQTSQDPQEHVPVPPPEPEIADEDTADEAQALASAVEDSPPSAASSTPEASSAPPRPPAAAAKPPPKPASKPSPKPASKPSPKPAPSPTPKPPPPKPASDLDDLSNPYR